MFIGYLDRIWHKGQAIATLWLNETKLTTKPTKFIAPDQLIILLDGRMLNPDVLRDQLLAQQLPIIDFSDSKRAVPGIKVGQFLYVSSSVLTQDPN